LDLLVCCESLVAGEEEEEKNDKPGKKRIRMPGILGIKF